MAIVCAIAKVCGPIILVLKGVTTFQSQRVHAFCGTKI